MNDKNPEEQTKSKKDIKLYTYVDLMLENKLREFMKKYNIKKQAKIIRDSINHYIDYVQQMYQKELLQKEYNERYINELIMNAINGYEIGVSFYEELKQRLSPLKILLLMLKNFIDKPKELNNNIETAQNAIIELESLIKQHFESPKPERFVKKFDILHVEDNELERKTINTYFKGKGADIKSIETSEEGLEILKVSTPYVILLDVNLKTSKINGDKFCKMLKSKEQYCDIPIILMTATISEKEKGKLLTSTGADNIIIKPIGKLADLDLLFTYLK